MDMVQRRLKIRKNLHDRFDLDSNCNSPMKENLKNIDGCKRRDMFALKKIVHSRSVFRTGAEKLSKTFKNVKKSLGSLTQNLRLRNGRCHHFAAGNNTLCWSPMTPQKRNKQRDRTPIKLYSPFGIETPHYATDCRKPHSLPSTPEHELSPKHRKGFRGPWSFITKKKPRTLFV